MADRVCWRGKRKTTKFRVILVRSDHYILLKNSFLMNENAYIINAFQWPTLDRSKATCSFKQFSLLRQLYQTVRHFHYVISPRSDEVVDLIDEQLRAPCWLLVLHTPKELRWRFSGCDNNNVDNARPRLVEQVCAYSARAWATQPIECVLFAALSLSFSSSPCHCSVTGP